MGVRAYKITHNLTYRDVTVAGFRKLTDETCPNARGGTHLDAVILFTSN
jgi:hypothetical protein